MFFKNKKLKSNILSKLIILKVSYQCNNSSVGKIYIEFLLQQSTKSGTVKSLLLLARASEKCTYWLYLKHKFSSRDFSVHYLNV